MDFDQLCILPVPGTWEDPKLVTSCGKKDTRSRLTSTVQAASQ
jgi:hypothetical protein